MKKRVLIVIPAFNEEQSVEIVALNCKRYGDVLVVDDGSTDRTAELAKNAGTIVVSNKENLGYEFSLNTGHAYALAKDYEIMVTMDADGQLPYDKIQDFIDAIDKGASVAIGKRNKISRLSERILAHFSSLISGVCDPYCGMKAYNLTVNQQSYFSRFNSTGTALTFDYIALDLPVANIEIEIKNRNGKSKFGGILASEIRLAPSMLAGIIRLLRILMDRRVRKK
jgi:glycosyltransferase involved in cell wall biosynthesis